MDHDTGHVGRRVRELRAWRDKSLRTTAALAGISPAYLSMIENGERSVTTRATLEGLARALQVSPAELGALPTTGVVDPEVGTALGHLVDVDVTLAEVGFGEKTVEPRPWGAIAADLERLCTVLRPRAEIAAQMALTPTLLRDLNAVYAVDPAHRRPALRGLILTLRSAAFDAKYLGAKGTPLVAVTQMLRAAEELDEPVWLGLARYCRAQMLGPGSRFRSRELSIAAVDELRPHMADRSVQQLAGMLHLNSALASATLGETERTAEHLREARQLAHRAADRQGAGFAQLSFNPTNVGFWEISLTREQGDAGKAVELAEKLRPEQVKSWPRQAAYFTDLGRALAAQKGRREDAALALVRAEQLSPVSVRANVWVRESVTDLLRRVKRDDMPGRELRGLAYRMGLAA